MRVVSRDRGDRPAPGVYSVCYVNAFQAQPGELSRWRARDPGLLLRDGDGGLVVDDEWDEALLDTSTAAKREALAEVVGAWIDDCAERGFRAVEPDNLDSVERSDGLLTPADNAAFARLLASRAHAAGLAVAQKNTTELLPDGPASASTSRSPRSAASSTSAGGTPPRTTTASSSWPMTRPTSRRPAAAGVPVWRSCSATATSRPPGSRATSSVPADRGAAARHRDGAGRRHPLPAGSGHGGAVGGGVADGGDRSPAAPGASPPWTPGTTVRGRSARNAPPAARHARGHEVVTAYQRPSRWWTRWCAARLSMCRTMVAGW